MKCHQILTGACNPGDKTFGVGSVEGVRLTAYAAGCNITILANNFQRVQIIPGICHNNVQISCVDVSNNTGKIAVAYENKVCVFEPTPLVQRDSKHGLDYWWVKTGELDLECKVASLSWNHEGTRLLTAGEILQMWKYNERTRFALGGDEDEKENRSGNWDCIWSIRPPNQVFFLAFSSDGTLFATAGKNDRLVRIWFQNVHLLLPSQTMDSEEHRENYGFIYVAHPRPVTGFSWRDTSKYMPRCGVANMLVTNCEDNISRLWCETVLPDDGLVSLTQIDPAATQDPHFRAHRQKQRFIERLKHMRQNFASRKMMRDNEGGSPAPIPSLPSSYSVHDFHNLSFQGSGVSSGMHFHLAATINALTDIPLVPAMNSSSNSGVVHKFSLHWLNNKEIYFSLETEKILQELAKVALKREDSVVEKELLQDPRDVRSYRGEMSPVRNIGSRAEEVSHGGGISHTPSVTSFSTDISQPSTTSAHQLTLSEAMDQRIEVLLQGWHQSSDLLFSVHPVDGSLLVWVADFLDEYQPGAFRQAQVSFSSRIPNAIPIGDASTMSSNVAIFNSKHLLNINQLLKEEMEADEPGSREDNEEEHQPHNKDLREKLVSVTKKYDVSPIVSMISKHENGTLNLWDVTFSPDTKFCQLLNISHKARVNGHRFRVNEITPHPVLPLLLTTSHHNMSSAPSGPRKEENFCSELILWRVDPISPISKPGSGGISELARINSRQISAFTNVAWIPTLLPSSVLGTLSNSPSACFVSSDGKSLRVYQAVIDARSLLGELNTTFRDSANKYRSTTSMASTSPAKEKKYYKSVYSSIVSAQSSARPGVVIDLDQIEDTQQNWQNTILLHTFHHEMVHGSISSQSGVKLGLIPSSMSAMVDLRENQTGFREIFYVVLAEKVENSTLMHMWKLILESPEKPEENGSANTTRSPSPEMKEEPKEEGRRVLISSTKVCTQKLPLPESVSVIQCVPAAGHLSSSSIYPACLAPYLLVTACSDNIIRFWTVVDTSDGGEESFEWEEWKMETEHISSAIEVPGYPLSVSAAYTGRIAVAYRSGESFTRKNQHSNSSYVNLFVAIYECESSGGIEWILEDKIVLKNIEVPRVEPAVDQTVFQSQDRRNNAFAKLHKNLYEGSKLEREEGWKTTTNHHPQVPSQATLSKLKEGFGDTCASSLVQKQLVQLDWVSNEDGSHLLTVAVANKVLLLTTVSADVSHACKLNRKDNKKTQSSRPLLRKSSSIGLQPLIDELKWMIFRRIELQTADGLPPLPMSVSWARDGVLMCAMDNEVAVYSQWQAEVSNSQEDSAEDNDQRRLKETELISISQETKPKNVHGGLKGSYGADARFFNDSVEKAKKLMGGGVEDFMSDMGLFEASHLSCPVLPQYHPKQLMELLHSGKIRWVKAILNHLVKCVCPKQQRSRHSTIQESEKTKDWTKSRNLSIIGGQGRSPSPIRDNQRSSTSAMPEEHLIDHAEVYAISPLPLWMLLEADKEKGSSNVETQEYNELFSDSVVEGDMDFDLNLEDEDSFVRQRRLSMSNEKQGLSFFGPRQARVLSKLLTHSQLPGLTSLDQMHLMALADTVASCNVDIAERFAIDAAKSAISKETNLGSTGKGEISLDSLDDCGLRFLLAMKHYCYLQRCLPLSQRSSVAKAGLNSSNIIWAFHSESEEELVSLIPCVSRGNPTWSELREVGVAWWLRSNVTLRKLVENLAKASFQKNQEPLDAALYYLAMKKKSLVWGLFRSIKDDKMTQFFKNDFNEERWRKAALKNAFALMGKQRFLHAAAFFLLSGSLKDAMEIIVSKLEDIQLAILVGRLYDGVTETHPACVQDIIKDKILGFTEAGEYSSNLAHPDPFLRSIGHWILKEYDSSLTTLMERNVGNDHPSYVLDEKYPLPIKTSEADPMVFNFYVYLRTHPLIIRHKLSKNSEDKNKAMMLSGFKKGSMEGGSVLIEDSVSPLERKLYFSTANFHLRGGCPALALDVLSKLPARVSVTETKKEVVREQSKELHHDIMQSGRLDENALDWGNLSSVSPTKETKSDEFGLDWGPAETVKPGHDDDELKLEWSEDDEDNDSEVEEDKKKLFNQGKSVSFHTEEVAPATESKPVIDIIAQQMKFTACLKIMMEELSTLATGFESDGGLIRYQLYVWLEKEVEALKKLCNYNGVELANKPDKALNLSLDESKHSTEAPALHQVIMNEKIDFETRLLRASRRKKWLAANQTLLRTLHSYCGLHGANGGGLVNVRMELVLLLQELQQEQTQHQLLSPLPFPTTLPLLSACIAQQKTVITDPVHYLQSFSHDILYQICCHKPLPAPDSGRFPSILLIRDLSIALSSCVYQSLCDSDNISRSKLSEELKKAPGMDAIGRISNVVQDSYLMFSIGNRRSSAMEDVSQVFTEPSKWPGVTSLRALLDRDKDDDTPNLCVLLCETYVAVYMSLLLYALSTCDCHVLYRLISQVPTQNGWTQLFGGGSKKIVKVETSVNSPLMKEGQDMAENILSSGINTVTNITKQRIKLNMKLLNVQIGSPPQDSAQDTLNNRKPATREEFFPPESSLVAKLLSKPTLDANMSSMDYDSAEESDQEDDIEELDDEDDDPFSNAPVKSENLEHSNPNSYSWAILRLTVLSIAQKNIEKFLSIAGIELIELPITSSLVYKCLRTTEKWAEVVTERLMRDGKPPDNYIPGCFPDAQASGPLINKYKAMLEPSNTPFSSKGQGLGAIKRLWKYLVHQESVQPIFIRYIFGKSRKMSITQMRMEDRESRNGDEINHDESVGQMKIIHKDPDNLTAFCLNKVSGGLVAVSTPREILEINMALLLHPSSWSDRSEDEAEFDILKMQEASGLHTSKGNNFMVPPGDPFQFISGFSGGAGHSSVSPSNSSYQVSQGARTSPVVKRHRQDGVRRLCAHPHLPLYLSGGQDGSVLLWEWSHNQHVTTVRQSSVFARVNRIVFSEQGNKFGVSDGDGNVSLWQANNTAQPYLNLEMFTKNCADLVFQGGSSSLLASAGHSSDGRNVALWDTLMPSKRACVQSFNCHEAGASSLIHATQHQILISAGKKGVVNVWDIRQARLLHAFKAHDSAVKTMCLDAGETMFATGSADGDIKVFDLVHHKILHSFHAEHARHGLFKNMSQGVAQVSLIDSTLYSCGADGTFRMRRLPERDIYLNYN